MTIETFESLAVVLLAVLPGALYTWAYEREDGAWEVTLTDRVARFVGVSAVFSIVTAPVIYLLVQQYQRTWSTGDVLDVPVWAWVVYGAYVLIPAVLGTLVGIAAKRRKQWARYFTGPSPTPRGWDALFRSPHLTGWIRLRLKDGAWLFGVWGDPDDAAARPGSFAAGFPHTQDLYLVDTCEVDVDGSYLSDENGYPIRRGIAVLINWDQVAYAEFIEA